METNSVAIFCLARRSTELSDEHDHKVQDAADSLAAALEGQRQEIINQAYAAS